MLFLIFHGVLIMACIGHILLRRYRQPESRVAWLIVVLVLPYLGALAYVLLGQTSIGRKRIARLQQAIASLPRPERAPGWEVSADAPVIPDHHAPLFRVGESISGYTPVGGNQAQLMADSDAAIAHMVADIDQAAEQVHLLFYIWLDDHNGTRMAEALMRAARRGVTCRAMVDDLGSRTLIRSALWQALMAAGVQTRRALPVGNPLLRMLKGRVDLRNHRKILVIDNAISYCGSQNCADPAFLPKARYAPWVDAVMRFQGPVVRQNQHLFASDWMGSGGDDVAALLRQPMPPAQAGFTAQVIGTGPTSRNSAMPEMFETLLY
nr:phospholipase D-like domain-containing protein [Thiolinea sp.]